MEKSVAMIEIAGMVAPVRFTKVLASSLVGEVFVWSPIQTELSTLTQVKVHVSPGSL
jgi:hypothetical protein